MNAETRWVARHIHKLNSSETRGVWLLEDNQGFRWIEKHVLACKREAGPYTLDELVSMLDVERTPYRSEINDS